VSDSWQFLIRHSSAVLFAVVLAEQLSIPVPAAPFLLAAGAFARSGETSLASALVFVLLAAFLAQSAWYEAGRRGGRKILTLVCRVAVEPDACVRRTENVFTTYGLKSLLVAPFIPGLGAVARPLAGMIRVPFGQFAFFGLSGVAVWAGLFLGLGYAFGHPLLSLLESGTRAGARLSLLAAGAIVAYAGWKLIQRRIFVRRLRTARILPEELRRRMLQGQQVMVLDLRHAMDVQLDPRKIPGALHISPDDLERRHAEIPRDQEIVLYCA
jgi:membrane protein DedA with SNARE-associated domain